MINAKKLKEKIKNAVEPDLKKQKKQTNLVSFIFVPVLIITVIVWLRYAFNGTMFDFPELLSFAIIVIEVVVAVILYVNIGSVEAITKKAYGISDPILQTAFNKVIKEIFKDASNKGIENRFLKEIEIEFQKYHHSWIDGESKELKFDWDFKSKETKVPIIIKNKKYFLKRIGILNEELNYLDEDKLIVTVDVIFIDEDNSYKSPREVSWLIPIEIEEKEDKEKEE